MLRHQRAFGSSADEGIELGTAHVNLEELLRRAHEPSRELLPVVTNGGEQVGQLMVSVQLLVAMRFAAARLGSGAAERLGIEVCVESCSLRCQ